VKHRVLQFIDNFHRGGTELQTVQLVRLLNESGRFAVHLACTRSDGPLREEVEKMGLPPIPAFPLGSFHDRNMLVQLGRLRAYVREHGIELVHTHDFYTNVFGILGSALGGVKARVASRRETNGVRTPAQRFAENRIFRLASAVTANSEAVRTQLINEGLSPAKVLTIYNGLDAARYRMGEGWNAAAARESFGLPADTSRPVVTIVANIGLPVKDHPTFLRAASRVHDEVPQAVFALAGEGKLVAPMKELAASLGLADSVFFLGRCSRIAELLAVSDVGVLSSTAEGFSNSIIEYMAAGLPVVATDVGGAREVIEEDVTGHLVTAGDADTMGRRLVELLCNPDRATAMGAAGRAVVTSRFSLEHRLDTTEALYSRLLAARSRAA
jgi:glycosyltransferase involved in cell wall biosynthesis